MGFKFSIASDVREVLRGNEAMEQGFEDTADSLDDLAREAQRAGGKVSSELDGVAKDVDSASDKLEKKFRDAFKEVERGAKSAGDEVGDRLKDGSRKAEDGVDRVSESVGEFKDEAKQNFSEVASSFSGGIDGAADLVQGTLGGLAGSLAGPAGLAAGVLAGIGGAMFTSFQENAANSEQRISDMYQDMIESGNKYVSEGYLKQAVQDIIDSAEGAAISYDDLLKAAETSGISAGDLARAYAGSADDIAAAQAVIADKQDEIRAKFDGAPLDGPARQRVAQLQDISNALEDQSGDLDSASAKADLYNEAISAFPSEKRTDVQLFTNQAQEQLDSWTRQVPTVSAQAAIDTTQADRDLDAWIRRRRVIGVSTDLTMQPV